LEATGETVADLSDVAINQRLKYTKSQLYRIIRLYLGDKPQQYEIADLIIKSATEPLRVLRDHDDNDFLESAAANSLEAIVRTDGSRPCFFVRDGTVDLKSSPAGTWENDLQASKSELDLILPRIGRIDDSGQPQGFCGTGFLVHKNFMITNRHVLQLIASRDNEGTWNFKDKIFVDFNHEFRTEKPSMKRQLKDVVFASADPIASNGTVNHSLLDLALIELDGASSAPQGEIFFDISEDWARPDASIYLIGYPGSPEAGTDSLTLLEKLFQLSFGFKRLSPGKVVTNAPGLPAWTFSHDATTLGGNSGSLAIIPGREKNCVGLHYGGRSSKDRINWGHILGATLTSTERPGSKTLKRILEDLDVSFIDRIIS
jgi:V8-like Glu-specific endopeptidase